MSFGQNLQYLRKMHRGMTQDRLAERLSVSRQTVSKWEMDAAFPEMETALALCKLFSCSLDELLRGNLNLGDDAYSNIRLEETPPFRYVRYAVISAMPEDDAVGHITAWAAKCGIEKPDIVGWDFPFVSQEQINVYHMHGYAAACILPPQFGMASADMEILSQPRQKYTVITIRDPFKAAFSLIPNAYKTLMRYMEVNGLKHKESKEILPCFEKVYEKEGTTYMDVYIAFE